MPKLIKPLEVLISSGIRIDSVVARTEESSPVIKVGREHGIIHIGPKDPGKKLIVTFNKDEARGYDIRGFIISPPRPSYFQLSDGNGRCYQYDIHSTSNTLPDLSSWKEVSLRDYHNRLNELAQR